MGSGSSSVEHGLMSRPRTAQPIVGFVAGQPDPATGGRAPGLPPGGTAPQDTMSIPVREERNFNLPGTFCQLPNDQLTIGSSGQKQPGQFSPAYLAATPTQSFHSPYVSPFQTAAAAAVSDNPSDPSRVCHLPHEVGSGYLAHNHSVIQSDSSIHPAPPPSIGFKPQVIGAAPDTTEMADRGRPSSARPMSGRPGSARQGADWGTSQDLTYMRVLSAEEFVVRMKETDDAIKYWSQHIDRDLQYSQVKEHMGIRGHLQDELLRIQDMLSADDPELQGLRDFENEYPEVVSQLRELHTRSQAIQIQSIDIGMATEQEGTQTTGTTLPSIGAQNSLVGADVSRDSVQNQSIGTQSSVQGQNTGTQGQGLGHDIAVGVIQDEEVIDTQLRSKFVAEENHVNDDFTKQITRGGQQLTQSDMDRLLSEHAVSMQALRKKQDIEREKYKELLQAKKQNRLLKRRAANQKEEILPPIIPKQKGDCFFIDFSSPLNQSKKIPKDNSGPKSTWFYVDFNEDKSERVNNKVNNQNTMEAPHTTSPPKEVTGSRTSVKVSDTQSTFSDETTATQGQGHGEGSLNSTDTKSTNGIVDIESDSESLEDYDDDFEEDFEDEEAEEEEDDDDQDTEGREDLKATLKDDLWTTLNDNDGMSKEAFQDLLGAYRDQEDGRKAIRGAEQLRHKSSFLAKLAERKKKTATDSDSVSSGSSLSVSEDPFEKELEEIRKIDGELSKKLLSQRKNLTDDEFQELLRRHLADVERLRRQRAGERARLDARLQERLKTKKGQADEEDFDQADEDFERELTELDNKLQEELRRRGRNIEECDLEELLEHYRRQQEALLNRRKSEKSKLDDILKKKLADKKLQKKKNESRKDEKRMSLKGADEAIFQEIQHLQAQGNLTEEAFSNLLGSYLDQADQSNRDSRRKLLARQRKNDKEADMNAASTLVQESQEQTKQIKGIRQRERELMDQKLKRKLQAKKQKNINPPVDD